MNNYRATESDIRELADAHERVTEVRRELETAEDRVRAITQRLHSAETQLANAIRQVCRGHTD